MRYCQEIVHTHENRYGSPCLQPTVQGTDRCIKHQTREQNLQRLYSHLVKRVFDQYGITIDEKWEQRVLSGEHDVPLPRD